MPGFSRKILAAPYRICLILFLVSLISACAQPGKPATSTQPAPAEGKISFMVFGDPAELQVYKDLVQAFNSKYPHTSVEVVHIPSQSDYLTRLATDFAAGTPADVIVLNYRRVAAFASRQMLEPLDAYLSGSSQISEADFYSQAIEPFRWQGQLQCLPLNISSLAVYYNKDLFDAAGQPYPQEGWTWDDFLQTAQNLTRDLDADGKIDQYGLGVEPSLIRLAPFIWQNGGDLVDNYTTPHLLTLYTSAGMEAISWFVDLQVKHHVVPNAEEEAAENSESRFLNGRLGMYLNSRRGVPTYRTITAFDWDVAGLPRKELAANVLHSDGYCLPAAGKNKAAAWQFVEFAGSADGQRLLASTGRSVPSMKAIAESPAFLDPSAKPEHSRVFLDAIPSIRPVPVMATWIDVEEIASEEIERAFYGQASVMEAVTAAVDRAQRYFSPEEQ